MKRMIVVALLLLCGHCFAQEPFDGPYVRKGTVYTILRNDDLLIPKTAFRKDTLLVIPEGHPDWAFTVKLRDTLVNDHDTYPSFDNCLFMSDIEGEFANFRKLLLAAGVIDKNYHWIYGNRALIIPGDLFDRGKDVVPELWLLYKLEDEAKAAGGLCLVILGNHAMMNLSGDHRYTDAKYFKDAWLLHMDIDALYGKDTELGRWLRTKNIIAKVGNVLVMHGGMSPVILQQRQSLGQLNANKVNGKDALFWYRGYFMGQKATMAEVDSTLAQYGCKYIVVGHTIVKWNIACYYGGKVIGVDVDEHSGHTEAALLEYGKWFTIDASGKKRPLVYKPANDLVSEKDIL